MQIAQHITQLLRPLNDLVRVLCAAVLEQALQAFALDIIHDNQEAVITINHIDNAGQMGMVQLFQHLRLCHQALVNRGKVSGAILADLFDCPGFVGALIDGKVDHAHAAVANLAQYFVFSVYDGADSQHGMFLFQQVRIRIAVMLSSSRRLLFSSVSVCRPRFIAASSGAAAGHRVL